MTRALGPFPPGAGARRMLRHGFLPQLGVFEASVRHGCIARAAEELHMAAPTASVQIRKLSETLGLRLFEQVGKRIYPTDAGCRVYESCGEVFRALAALDASLAEVRGLSAAHLTLAVTSSAKYFAPRLLGAFMERHPGVDAALRVHNRQGLVERLARNEDDLYLFAHPPYDREVIVQAVVPNPLVVVARRDHPLAGERGIAFARLAREPFLLREPGSGTRTATLQAFARHGATPRTRMELASDEAVREAVLAGLGVAIMPRHTLGIDPDPPGLACLDVEGFPIENHWHLVYPVGKDLSPAARAFLDFARANARRIAFGERALPAAVAPGPAHVDAIRPAHVRDRDVAPARMRHDVPLPAPNAAVPAGA